MINDKDYKTTAGRLPILIRKENGMTNTTDTLLCRTGILVLMMSAPLSLTAQDDSSAKPANSLVAAAAAQPADADELSAIVDEIRSLKTLLGEIRGDVAKLREALEDRENASAAPGKPKPYAIELMPEIKSEVRIPARQSVLFDEGRPVARIAIADPKTVEVVQFTPEQIGLVGMKPGVTTVTVWFDDERTPAILLVTVYESKNEPLSIDLSSTPKQSRARQSIEEALDEQTEVDAIDQPLIEVIRQLRIKTGQNFAIDLPAIEEEGITTSTAVNIKLSGVTLRSALKILLGEFNLTWVVEDEVIKITSMTRAMGTLDVRAYRVGALLMPDEDKEQQLERLIELVQTTIEPNSWQEVGGLGSIKSFPGGDSIFIRQHQSVHHRLELLLRSMERLMAPSTSSKIQSQSNRATSDQQSAKSNVVIEHVLTDKLPLGGPMASERLVTTIDPGDGRVLRVENGRRASQVVTRQPRVQVAEGLYVELPSQKIPVRSGIPMLMRVYKPSPELVRVFSKEGSSRIDDLHGLLAHIKATINPDSWTLPDAKTDVVFDNQILIFHTLGTHERIARLLKRMEAEAPVEDFKLQPAAIQKR